MPFFHLRNQELHMSEFYQDIIVPCRDCKVDFPYTGGEQRFFAEKGFSAPTRCKPCREARKADKATSGGPTAQPMTARPKAAPEVIQLRGGYSAPTPVETPELRAPKNAGRKPQKGRRSRDDYEEWGLPHEKGPDTIRAFLLQALVSRRWLRIQEASALSSSSVPLWSSR